MSNQIVDNCTLYILVTRSFGAFRSTSTLLFGRNNLSVIYSWCHIFWNVPDSWGALGLRAVPLFRGGSTGSSRCELHYNKRWKAWRQNASENARQHRHLFVNGQKQRRTISPATMSQLFASLITHRCTYPASFPVNVLRNYQMLQLSNDGHLERRTDVWYPVKSVTIQCDDSFIFLGEMYLLLQEVHELLGNYDLKYCFVDKYKGTGWLNCLSILMHLSCSFMV